MVFPGMQVIENCSGGGRDVIVGAFSFCLCGKKAVATTNGIVFCSCK